MGSGAGANPTASAVISDIVFIARSGQQVERWMAGDHPLTLVKDLHYSFYLRFQTMEQPGVLADIARVLADHGISIARFHQEEGEEPVQVVVMTHHASEDKMAEAIKKIDDMPIILEPTTVIRMLDQL
jgi:homoserine dehydrogenase